MNSTLMNFSAQAPRLVRARRLITMLPGQEVIEDGALLAASGRIQAVGHWARMKSHSSGSVEDLGEVTITPGLINAHVHLELSHLGPPPFKGRGFSAWVAWLIAQPLEKLTPKDLDQAVGQMTACGTAGLADITSRNPAMVAKALDQAGLDYVLQHEVFGFAPPAPLPDIPLERLALAGHALYSTATESLRRAKAWDAAHGRTFSLHLAEHQGEVELLATGQGEFADLLRHRVLPRDWRPPELSPAAFADRLGLLDDRTLAVHAVHLSGQDMALLAQRRVTVCLCPRSNRLIGVGQAKAKALAEAGVPLCLGTDSLASVQDLDLWAELRALVNSSQAVPGLATNLAMLTRTPAKALGFTNLGTLGPGAIARLAVLPKDLEEALDD